MNKILEVYNCKKVPIAIILSTFESNSGNQMYAVTFINARGKVKDGFAYNLSQNGDLHAREFFNKEVALDQ